MTRSSPSRGRPIAAAKWPLLFAGSVLLVAIVVAAPVVVHLALRDTIGTSAATWVAVGLGAAMLIAIAIVWVLLRAERHEPEDRAKGVEPT